MSSYEIINSLLLIWLGTDNLIFAKRRYMHWTVALMVDRTIEDQKCVICQHPTDHDELLGVKKTISIMGEKK